MSSASASSPTEAGPPWWRRISFVPRSLFARLFIAVLMAVLLAQGLSVILFARDRDRILVEGNVRELSRRIVDITFALQMLDPEARVTARDRMDRWPPEQLARVRRPPPQDDRVLPPDGPPPAPLDRLDRLDRPALSQAPIVPPPAPDFRRALEKQLESTLGPSYKIAVVPAHDPNARVISLTRQPPEGFVSGGGVFDVTVTLPDNDLLQFRVSQGQRREILPRNLVRNLVLLVVLTALVLFLVARSITRPLSELARAAEAVGRDVRRPPLKESGARELREAARAFNTMRDRMQRYLDSRTRVLAAMSHDLKTPLTRMRLRVEQLGDEELRERFARDVDEMTGMVRGSLGLLSGLTDDEASASVDVNKLLATIQSEFHELKSSVQVSGRANGSFHGKPQALKRCLTNLISNAVKYGARAQVIVEDGAALVIRVRDDGPGLSEKDLEQVFEPFYRVEASRNRDTGGTGLGLSIARDIAQTHGGSLVLKNLPVRGLEATLTLPRPYNY